MVHNLVLEDMAPKVVELVEPLLSRFNLVFNCPNWIQPSHTKRIRKGMMQ
jgi:hypothetical protein